MMPERRSDRTALTGSSASPGDIYKMEPAEILAQAEVQEGDIALLAAGPPCQPYSKSAFWAHGGENGSHDPRANAVPAYFRVVEAALPRVFLLENVKGFAFLKSQRQRPRTSRLPCSKV